MRQVRNIQLGKRKKVISILLFCLFSLSPSAAQGITADSVANESKPWFGKRLVNKISNNYFKVKYDTNYVQRPRQKWLVRLLGNQSGNYIHAKGTVNDVWSKYDLHNKRKTTLGVEVNFCDIAASYSINPEKNRGNYNDYEFNFEYHGQKISFNVNYRRSTSLSGDMHLGNIDHLDEEGLRMNVTNVAAYYIFNHRRFSFPAALYQNYYQRRSAGSWLVGASFQGGSIRTTDELKERSPHAPDVHLTFANVALGGGRIFNYEFGKHAGWLLHLSALPSVVVYKHNRLTVNGDKKRDHGLSFNMIFNERAALIYHFTPWFNAGASVMMSNSIFDNGNVSVNQNEWLARAFLGFRF